MNPYCLQLKVGHFCQTGLGLLLEISKKGREAEREGSLLLKRLFPGRGLSNTLLPPSRSYLCRRAKQVNLQPREFVVGEVFGMTPACTRGDFLLLPPIRFPVICTVGVYSPLRWPSGDLALP